MATIELYQIEIQADVWRFTSSQSDVLYKGFNWQSHAIERGASIEQSDDPLRADTSFEVSAGSTLANIALNPPLNVAPKITILRSEDGLTFYTVFAGRLMAGVWNDGFVSVELEAVHTELQITGLTETVTPHCRYSLGSRKCGHTESPRTVTVAAVNGNLVTLNESLSLEYHYGRLKQGHNHHYIDTQPSSKTLRLLHPATFTPGEQVEVTRGCDRTLATCHSRFNNAINFGGAVNLPTKNPYIGDPIDR
ncbi:phage BR0599 family protein [Photobacterium sp.]|uniref:phage BR0599 family protein n=1 Tax=Photobacterium sp. TaxID=660 RepID=UPI00299DB4E1|nr:phage BR0599 family protein [Photobacterium sp.]MDX1301181.1 phage BR0599 family protein [Photobacterium sp.]